MSVSFNSLAEQLIRLSFLISKSDSMNKSIVFTNSPSKKRRRAKSVFLKKNKKNSKSTSKTPKLSRTQNSLHNARLMPWVQLDDKIKNLQHPSPSKRYKKSSFSTPKNKKNMCNTTIDYNNSEPNSIFSSDDDELLEYNSDFYDLYSEDSMDSDTEDFLISEVEKVINSQRLRKYFHKFEQRFFIRKSMYIREQLQSLRMSSEQNENRSEDLQTEPNLVKNVSMENVNTITVLDSEEKEKLIDIIFNSSEI